MRTCKEIVPLSELNKVFCKLNYGPNTDPRKKLKELLLKIASGYWIGSGSQLFTNDLGLMYYTKKKREMKLTKKGMQYLYAAFEDDL